MGDGNDCAPHNERENLPLQEAPAVQMKLDGDTSKDAGEMVPEKNTLKTAARIKDSPSKNTLIKEKSDTKGITLVKKSVIIDADKDSNKENRGCADVGAISENGVSSTNTDLPKVNGLKEKEDLELGTHADLMDDKVEVSNGYSSEGARGKKRKRLIDDLEPCPKRPSMVDAPPKKSVNDSLPEAGTEDQEEADKLDEKNKTNEDLNGQDDSKEDGEDDDEDTEATKENEETEAEKKNDDDVDDASGDEEEYEVEEIVDYAFCKETERHMYLVQWKGWESEHNPWEPPANLDCKEEMINFYLKRVQQRAEIFGQKKRQIPLPPDPRTQDDFRDSFLEGIYTKPTIDELNKLFQEQKSPKATKRWTEAQLQKEIGELAVTKSTKNKRQGALIKQLQLRDLKKHRDKQIQQLKNWEEAINLKEKEKDGVAVTVENLVDLQPPPTSMEYILAYKATDGIDIPDSPPIGCECKTSCGGKSCCPATFWEVDRAYDARGKLKLDVGRPIYECNKSCQCPPDCRNRVVRNGRKAKLGIYRTENGCGWGVKALEKIKQGSFVVQYVGEVITSEEAERRGEGYDAQGLTYLFDLDFNRNNDNLYTVDAARYGNLSHFINHSCDPNLNIFNVWINCIDPDLPQLCLFARRDIKKGEQLTFDYSQSTQNPAEPTSPGKSSSKALAPRTPSRSVAAKSSVPNQNRTECLCGAKNCRKQLF